LAIESSSSSLLSSEEEPSVLDNESSSDPWLLPELDDPGLGKGFF
jgi:hypothetical protein